jgi:hypothetical protein
LGRACGFDYRFEHDVNGKVCVKIRHQLRESLVQSAPLCVESRAACSPANSRSEVTKIGEIRDFPLQLPADLLLAFE